MPRHTKVICTGNIKLYYGINNNSHGVKINYHGERIYFHDVRINSHVERIILYVIFRIFVSDMYMFYPQD